MPIHQVEPAQRLLIESQPVGIKADLPDLRRHHALQLLARNCLVASDIVLPGDLIS